MRVFDPKEIIDISGVHPLKVKNIYLYGSRVYGTATEDSDYDFIVVASSMNEAIELKKDNLNVHVHTPDKFQRDLFSHDIHCLECIYAPDFAKIQEKVNYADKNFKFKHSVLRYKLMNQSFNSFHKAKMKILDGDYYIGTKSLFHSLRILDFGIQILEHGKIADFSSANHYWDEIKKDEFEDWSDYRKKYLGLKISLERKFNDEKYGKGDIIDSITQKDV